MTLLFFEGLSSLSIASKSLVVIIVSGFMPLTAMTFFYFMMPNKEREYSKALDEMGIGSSRKVRDVLSPAKYILPVGFAFLICFLAITFFMFASEFTVGLNQSLFLEGASFGEGGVGLIRKSLSVLSWAFMGSFIWSSQNIIRRLIAYDLSPNVYYSAGIRIILATSVALSFSFFLSRDATASFGLLNTLPVIAFLTGMFPERIMQYLINFYKNFVNPDDLNEKELSLYRIEGMSMQHKERLQEMGIDNAQNLATASLTQLLIETPYGARQLLDWIGQAKLLCYAKNDIDNLRSVGIRTVFDLCKGGKTREALREISDSVGINTPLLQVVFNQIMDDEGIRSLHRFQHRLNSPSSPPEEVAVPDTSEIPESYG